MMILMTVETETRGTSRVIGLGSCHANRRYQVIPGVPGVGGGLSCGDAGVGSNDVMIHTVILSE